MSDALDFDDFMFELARRYASHQPDEMPETRGLSNFDVYVQLLSLRPQPVSEEICMICGEQSAIVTDYQEWIQCERCERWVHQYCDGVLNAELAKQLHYVCPRCRALALRPHPCNVDERLGRDPRFHQQEKQAKKARKRKGANANNSGESDNEHTTLSTTTAAAAAAQPRLPPLSPLELQAAFGDGVEEKPPPERRRAGVPDGSAVSVVAYANGAFNALRLVTAAMFRSLQHAARAEAADVATGVDAQRTDVCFANYLALFRQLQLEQLDQAGPAADAGAAERERRHQLVVREQIAALGLQPARPRQNARAFTPVLAPDADLRARVGLAAFDGILEAAERNRMEYVRTLLPSAAQAAYIYQNEAGLGDPAVARRMQLDNFVRATQKILQIFRTDTDATDLSYRSYLPAEQLLTRDVAARLEGAPQPALLSPRQWLDLSMRGVQDYPGLGLTRMTLLNAIVNVSLGLNIYEKPYGVELAEHIIQFGVSSARRLLERRLHSCGNAANIEPGTLFRCARRCDHEACECRIQNGVVGCAEMVQRDQPIPEWDILETPTSVVWGLRMVQRIVDEVSGAPAAPPAAPARRE